MQMGKLARVLKARPRTVAPPHARQSSSPPDLVAATGVVAAVAVSRAPAGFAVPAGSRAPGAPRAASVLPKAVPVRAAPAGQGWERVEAGRSLLSALVGAGRLASMFRTETLPVAHLLGRLRADQRGLLARAAASSSHPTGLDRVRCPACRRAGAPTGRLGGGPRRRGVLVPSHAR